MRIYLDGAKKLFLKVVKTSAGEALQVNVTTKEGAKLFAISLPRQRNAVLLLDWKGVDGKRYAGVRVHDLRDGEEFFTLFLPAKFADQAGKIQEQLLGEKPFEEVVLE